MPAEAVVGLNWFAAGADVVAGFCLAIPALRLSRHLLQLKVIQEPQTRDLELERLRERYISAMSERLAQWDARDHRLLLIGFAAFVLGAIAKLSALWMGP